MQETTEVDFTPSSCADHKPLWLKLKERGKTPIWRLNCFDLNVKKFKENIKQQINAIKDRALKNKNKNKKYWELMEKLRKEEKRSKEKREKIL